MVNWKYDPIRKDYYDIHNPTLRATRIDKPGYVYSGATISKGKTFASSETVTNTKLHNLVDAATISDIVNADIASGAAIDESKISFDGASSSAVLVGAYDQAISGTKTFSSFPVTPSSAPSSDYQTANKKYVDDNATTLDYKVKASSDDPSAGYLDAKVDDTTIEESSETLQVKDSGITSSKVDSSISTGAQLFKYSSYEWEIDTPSDNFPAHTYYDMNSSISLMLPLAGTLKIRAKIYGESSRTYTYRFKVGSSSYTSEVDGPNSSTWGSYTNFTLSDCPTGRLTIQPQWKQDGGADWIVYAKTRIIEAWIE